MKTIYYLLIIFAFMIFSNFTCDDCEDRVHDQSDFAISLRSTQSSVDVGDTLILDGLFNSTFELKFSQTQYDNADQLIEYGLEIFEITANSIDAADARTNFDFVGIEGDVIVSQGRPFKLSIWNTCGSDLCMLTLGLIPQKPGYYGIVLKSGAFGMENDCQSFTLNPSEIETDGTNNFEILSEINQSSLRINRVFYKKPEAEPRLYFFKVVE